MPSTIEIKQIDIQTLVSAVAQRDSDFIRDLREDYVAKGMNAAQMYAHEIVQVVEASLLATGSLIRNPDVPAEILFSDDFYEQEQYCAEHDMPIYKLKDSHFVSFTPWNYDTIDEANEAYGQTSTFSSVLDSVHFVLESMIDFGGRPMVLHKDKETRDADIEFCTAEAARYKKDYGIVLVEILL